MADLLEAVIHLSKLDAGVVEPNIGSMPLGDLLRRLAGEFAPQAAEKGLNLTVINTDLEVCSDPLLLERILRNLISNAIRYTERGRVLIGCRRHGATVSVEVWDTGIGIPPDQSSVRSSASFTEATRRPTEPLRALGSGSLSWIA